MWHVWARKVLTRREALINFISFPFENYCNFDILVRIIFKFRNLSLIGNMISLKHPVCIQHSIYWRTATKYDCTVWNTQYRCNAQVVNGQDFCCRAKRTAWSERLFCQSFLIILIITVNIENGKEFFCSVYFYLSTHKRWSKTSCIYFYLFNI